MIKVLDVSMLRPLTSGILASAVLLTGCGFHSEPLAAGGLVGSAVGAGTGAIIGASIANGDVAASALLGGAVGIPIGIAIGMIIDMSSEQTIQEQQLEVIQSNQVEISTRQREIEALRDQIRTDGPTGNPSEGRRRYQYNGHTYGNYYR